MANVTYARTIFDNRYGVCYDEAQAMEAAWVRRELTRLKRQMKG